MFAAGRCGNPPPGRLRYDGSVKFRLLRTAKPPHKQRKFRPKILDTAFALLLSAWLNSMTGLTTFRVSPEKRNRATAQ
jgi:hypothetical protein